MRGLRRALWLLALVLVALPQQAQRALAQEEGDEFDDFDDLAGAAPQASAPRDPQAATPEAAASKSGESSLEEGGQASSDKAGEANPQQRRKKRLRTGWNPLELAGIAAVLAYLVNYFVGRVRNKATADRIDPVVRLVLGPAFAFVGPATPDSASDGPLFHRDSPSVFQCWATGHKDCTACLLTLETCPRQDLFQVLASTVLPAADHVVLEVAMREGEVDPFLVQVCPRGEVAAVKDKYPEVERLAEKRTVKEVEAAFVAALNKARCPVVVLSDSAEIASQTLKAKIVPVLKRWPAAAALIEEIQFTDANELPVAGIVDTPNQVLRFRFKVPKKPANDEALGALIGMALEYISYLRSYQASKVAKKKCTELRQKSVKEENKQRNEERKKEIMQRKAQEREQARQEYEQLSSEQKAKRDAKEERKKAKRQQKSRMRVKVA